MFKNASIKDKNAVRFQKRSQSHWAGNRLPIAPNPPTPLYAPESGLRISLNWSIYPPNLIAALFSPAGKEPNSVYDSDVIL